MTTKQLDFIESLTEQLDLHPMTVLGIAKEIAEANISCVGQLDVKQASKLIEGLLDLKEGQVLRHLSAATKLIERSITRRGIPAVRKNEDDVLS